MRDHPPFPASPSVAPGATVPTEAREGCRSWLLSGIGSHLPWKWSKADRAAAIGYAWGIFSGGALATSLWGIIEKGTLNHPDVVLPAFICIVASYKACERFSQEREERKAMRARIRRHEGKIRTLANKLSASEEYGRFLHFQINGGFGSGNSGVPSVAPRGQLCRHPLGAGEGQVIRGPWEGAQS